MRRGKLIKGFLLYRLLKKSRLFPLIPIVPVTLLFSSLLTAVRALRRVKQLERRWAANPA